MNINRISKKWVILSLLCLTLDGHAQSNREGVMATLEKTSVEYVEDADTPPVYADGGKALLEYLQKNLKYPSSAKDMHVEGRVLISYVVDKEGKATNIVPLSFNKCKETDGKSIPQVALEKEMENSKMKPKAQQAYLQAVRDIITESIRIISQMPPAERPAMKDGEPVCFKMAMPITFKGK